MHTVSHDQTPSRRSHDRLERRARRRRALLTAAAAVLLGIVLVISFWHGQTAPARDGAPAWFPDARTLVFSVEAAPGRAALYRMDADGSDREALTDGVANDVSPDVSPDGTRIVFESDRDGNDEIYVMAVSDRQIVRLTDHPARDQAPAWSPDGRRIVFTSDRDRPAGADVYILDVDTGHLMRVTEGVTAWSPQLSPDGRRVAVQIDRDIYVVDLETGSRRRLTTDPANGMSPTWSPDGRRLAFVTTRRGRAEIYTMTADGRDQRLLVTLAHGHAIDPRWSPDGSHLAFVQIPDAAMGAAEDHAADNRQAIYTIEIASGIVTRLSR